MVNSKLIVIGGIALLLTGCAFDQQVVYKNVEVPVLYCPMPPDIVRPELPIGDLKPEDEKDPGLVGQKYKATVKMLEDHIKQLEEILQKYKDASKNSSPVPKVSPVK